MPRYRCPDPSHGARRVLLKSNYERVFECETSHRFYGRDDAGSLTLVDLISGAAYAAAAFQDEPVGEEPEERVRLNFMVDIPKVVAALDFDRLSLTPGEWKLISKVDGRSNLEEVRLLAGLRSDEAEAIFQRLIGAGVIALRRRGR